MKIHILARPPHTLKKDKLVEGVGGLRIMHDVGAKVHTLKGLKLHAKMIVADHKRAVVGSINLAPGSFDARRELAIETDAHHVVSRLSEVAQRDWDNSKKIDLTDEGLLADLEKRNAASAGAEKLVLKSKPRRRTSTELGRRSLRALSQTLVGTRAQALRARDHERNDDFGSSCSPWSWVRRRFGIVFNRVLPEHHLSKESKEIIHLGIGVIVTLTALVLGLLVASAKGSFDTKSDEIRHSSVKIIMVDRYLRQYGPEAKEARDLLRRWIDDPIAARDLGHAGRTGPRVAFTAEQGNARMDGLP